MDAGVNYLPEKECVGPAPLLLPGATLLVIGALLTLTAIYSTLEVLRIVTVVAAVLALTPINWMIIAITSGIIGLALVVLGGLLIARKPASHIPKVSETPASKRLATDDLPPLSFYFDPSKDLYLRKHAPEGYDQEIHLKYREKYAEFLWQVASGKNPEIPEAFIISPYCMGLLVSGNPAYAEKINLTVWNDEDQRAYYLLAQEQFLLLPEEEKKRLATFEFICRIIEDNPEDHDQLIDLLLEEDRDKFYVLLTANEEGFITFCQKYRSIIPLPETAIKSSKMMKALVSINFDYIDQVKDLSVRKRAFYQKIVGPSFGLSFTAYEKLGYHFDPKASNDSDAEEYIEEFNNFLEKAEQAQQNRFNFPAIPESFSNNPYCIAELLRVAELYKLIIDIDAWSEEEKEIFFSKLPEGFDFPDF